VCIAKLPGIRSRKTTGISRKVFANQAAMEALILVAETGGPAMLARIGVMRALNRHVEQVFDVERKSHHWGKRKLKRDQ
jgi:hypothetical protein